MKRLNNTHVFATFLAILTFLLVCPNAAAQDGDVEQLRREFEEWKQETNRQLGELRRENQELRDSLTRVSGESDAGISPALEEKLRRWFEERRAKTGLLDIKGAEGGFVTNVRFFGGIRERIEFVDNFTDFDTSHGDKTDFVDSRIRFGVALEFQDWVDAVFEVQNNSYFGDTSTEFGPNARNDNEDDIEIYQAYITFRKFFGTDAEVRVGRQEIVKGTQFLIGNEDFYSGLSFDAVRVMYEITSLKLEIDAWWARLSDNFADVAGDNRYDDDKRDFFGLYFTWKGIHDKLKMIDALEAYLLFVRDQTNNLNDATTLMTTLSPDAAGQVYVNDFVNEDRWTAGVRAHGRVFDDEERLLKYNFEFAFQFGDAGTAGPFNAVTGRPVAGAGSGMSGGEIKAFGMEANLRYQCRKWRFKPAVELYYAFASGDNNPFDEDQGTFNPLFQNSHYRMGLADLFQGENIHAIGLSAMFYPFSKLEIGGALHYFHLDRSDDFAAPGSVAPLMGRTAHVSDDLAWEFDLFINYRYSERLLLQIAYARVMMGDAVHDNIRALRGDGADDAVNRVYLNIVFEF